jgi:predicted DNA-binding protein
MSVCPNVNTPEWKNLEDVLGPDEAWKSWIRSKGETVTPLEGAFLMMVDQKPREASLLLTQYSPREYRMKATLATTPLELLRVSKEDVYNDELFKQWAITNNLSSKLGLEPITKTEKESAKKFSEFVEATSGQDLGDAVVSDFLKYGDDNLLVETPDDFYDIHNKTRAEEIMIKMADKLSNQFGLSYEMVTSDQAFDILAKTQTPYHNQPAFFLGGKIYLVSGKADLNSVLHEFAHPLVRMLALNNKALFNNLYTQLEATPEGQALINEVKLMYPELTPNDDRFIEEVVVHALANAAELITNKSTVENTATPASKGFATFIKELLYQLKQLFRKTFGKVNVKNLSSTTTLDELANMLTNKDFIIDKAGVTEQDIAMFKKVSTEQLNEMTNQFDNDPKRKHLQYVIDSFYTTTTVTKGAIESYKYKAIQEELSAESGKGLLNDLANALNKHTTKDKVDEKTEALNNMLQTKEKVQAVLNAVFTLKTVMDKISKNIQELESTAAENGKETLNHVHHYLNLFDKWSKFLEEGIKDLMSSGLPSDSMMVSEMGNVLNTIKLAKERVYNIEKRDVIPILTDALKQMQINMAREHVRRLESLQEKLGKAKSNLEKDVILKAIDQEDKEYAELEITDEKLRQILSGETKDLTWWNKELEGILNIDDPVIGGFGLILKEAYLRADRNAENKFQDFMRDIAPDLKKTGYSANNTKFWNDYMFEDSSFEYDPASGEMKEKKIFTFLNPVKNWRYEKRKKYNEFALMKDTATKEELAAKAKEIRDYERKYFHQKYKSEFYKTEEIFNEPFGDQAWLERELILEEISRERGVNNEYEDFLEHDNHTLLWRKYNQLYSLSHEDGTPKEGDALAKATLLRRHRQATQKFYERVPLEGAMQKALGNVVEQMQIKGLTPDEINEAIYGPKGWIVKNTKMAYKPEWYSERANILDRIKTITTDLKKKLDAPEYKAKLKAAGISINDIENLDVSDAFTYIIDLVSGFRNEEGQPVASDMGEKRLSQMHKYQDGINKAKEKLSLFTGMSVDEMEEYSQLQNKAELNNGHLGPVDLARLKELNAKQGALPITKFDQETLKGLFKQLNQIQFKEPTDDYLTVVNTYMNVLNQPSVDKTTASNLLDSDVIIPLLNKDAKFKEWFLKNHTKTEYFSFSENKRIVKWERLYAWSVTKPNNSKYIQKFTLKDPITGEEREFEGEPGTRFSYRRVKNEFRTIPVGLTTEQKQAYVGIVIDNMGNYLPKSYESEVLNPVTGEMDTIETAPDATYINESYYDMKKNSPDKFNLLKKVTANQLDTQKGLGRDSKLYMDIPRFRMDNYELMANKKYITEKTRTFSKVTQGVGAYIMRKGKAASTDASREEDDFERGLGNATVEEVADLPIMKFVKVGMEREDVDQIPIYGLSNLPNDLISKDVLSGMAKYLSSAEKQKALIEINPIAKSIKNVLSDERSHLKDMTKANQDHFDQRNIVRYLDKKGDKNRRRDLFEHIYNREFKGEIYGDNELNWLNKWTSSLMQGASFSFFAFNISSAVKNHWGMLWQSNMEAIAGHAYKNEADNELAQTQMNTLSYAKGKLWAKGAIFEWTNNLYGVESATDTGLRTQMVRNFDAIQGKRQDKFGGEASRSFVKDLASLSFFYSPRRFLEIEAGLQLFGGMMNHQMVEITENGATRYIPYIEAFELGPDGKMKLKDGIDKSWEVGGEKMLSFVNRLHQTSNQLQGSFAKFENPAAQQYFAFRLWSFMRRYFTSMFMARWQKNRYNFGLSNTYEGFYITFGKTMGRLFTSYGKYWPLMSPRERKAMRRIAADFVLSLVTTFIISVLFGYDDDDEDRFKKLKAMEDDGAMGWLGVHLLKTTMAVQSENESFIPLHGYGLDDYSKLVTNFSSIAAGPTIETYGTIIADLYGMATGDPGAYYKRDVGPYPWQKAESAKLWNHMAKIFGFSGSDISPTKGIQSVEPYKNTYK